MSSAAVVAASRDWVCIRTTTYEDRGEYLYLNKAYNQDFVWGPSSIRGQLPNTFCALYASDGDTRLTRIGRHPEFLLSSIREFGYPAGSSGSTSQRFADLLNFLFEEQAGPMSMAAPPIAALPVALDFRRALNVAACDNQPLVVALSHTPDTLRELEHQLAEVAWDAEFVGRLTYALVSDREELGEVSGMLSGDGIFVIESGQFGLSGEVVASWNGLDAGPAELKNVLREGLDCFDRSRMERADHVSAGLAVGASWEMALPKNAVVRKGAQPIMGVTPAGQ